MAVVPQKQIVNHEEAVTLFMACDMSKADWLLAVCMSSEGQISGISSFFHAPDDKRGYPS